MIDKQVSKYIGKVTFKDCIIGMKELPDDSVDLILADPPYNLSKGNVWKWDNSVELPGMGEIGIKLWRIGMISLF